MPRRMELIGALGALLRRIQGADTIDDVRGSGTMGNAERIYRAARKHDIKPMPWTPLIRVPHGTATEAQIADGVKLGIPEAEVRAAFANIAAEESLWQNDIYQVSARDLGDDGVHLSIKRIDQEPIHDWRDLLRIKDELVGRNCEAIELYPAHDRMVDTANQYHLWASKDPTYRFPVGFQERLVSFDSGTHHQREAPQ